MSLYLRGVAAVGPVEILDPRVRAAIEALGVACEVLPCDPGFADTAAFCAKYGIPPAESANAIVVASKKEPRKYAACLVLATTKLDVNRKVSELLGVRKLSFASGEETVAATGMMVGGVTLFGLPDDWPVYVDSRVAALPSVVVGGGNRSSKLRLSPAELLRIPGAALIEGLALDREGAAK
jgi:prolyl-tRNA editing enzyme YbaK/EbsC (Cys-tRNA(Pro) deacylase)